MNTTPLAKGTVSTVPDAGQHADRGGADRGRRLLRGLIPHGYLTPTVVLIAGLMVIPIVMVISYSFKDNVIVQDNPVFVGLANYTTVLTDPDFLQALRNTLIFIALSTAVHLILGLAFAMMLNSKLLGRFTKSLFRIIYILPWLFTIAVVAVVWRLMLDPYGVINYLLEKFGLADKEIDWLGNPDTALWSLTFINIWSGYPFFMISILAGLQGIPGDLYEAAAVDGAGSMQQFRYVTIPQLKPVLISMAVLDLIWTSQQFALIWMTTGGGPLGTTEMLSHLHLQAGVLQLRVLHRLGKCRDRAAGHHDPGDLLRPQPAEGSEVTAMTPATVAAPPTRQHRRRGYLLKKSALLIGLILGAVFAGFPVLWMLSTSFKPNGEVFAVPPQLVSSNFSFDAYRKILTDPTQVRFFINSYIVAVSVTVLTLFVAIMAAYAFSRFNFPGKTMVNVVIVSVQAVPPITLVIPYFGLIVTLGSVQHLPRA